MKSSSFEVKNNECCPLTFTIDPKSLYSEDRLQAIKVSPMNGTLEPKSKTVFW